MKVMNVYPKIADIDCNNIENISWCFKYSDSVEIQLLGDDLDQSLKNVRIILDNFKDIKIKYVVLHMPFSMVNICYIHSNPMVEKKFIKFIVDVIKMSLSYDIPIDILFHISMRTYEFVGIGGIEFLKYIESLVEGTKVGFLLENSIINLNRDDDELDSVTGVFKIHTSDKLKFCLDLCHFQASEYVLDESIELDKVLLDNLKNVHFSMTLENQGYKNKEKTHGRAHTTMKCCLRDLEYLRRKGINLNKVNLITEINESNYKTRPMMHKELYLLWGLRFKTYRCRGVYLNECGKIKIKRVS